MRALSTHVTVRRRLATASHYGLVVAGRAYLAEWRRSALAAGQRQGDCHAAVLRHVWCVRLASLRTWRGLTLMAWLRHAAAVRSDELCERRRVRRGLARWIEWAGGSRGSTPPLLEMAMERGSPGGARSPDFGDFPAIELRPNQFASDLPTVAETIARRANAQTERRAVVAERRAAAAERRAEAAEARAVELEVSVSAMHAALRQAKTVARAETDKERAIVKATFSRERDVLLRKLGEAMERAEGLQRRLAAQSDEMQQGPPPSFGQTQQQQSEAPPIRDEEAKQLAAGGGSRTANRGRRRLVRVL